MGVRRLFLCATALAASLAAVPAGADVPYEALITGAKGDLAELFDQVSLLKTLTARAPVSPEALRRRAEEDLGRLAEAAHSLGYWSAQLSYRIDTGTKPARVTVTVVPGPLYRVGQVTAAAPDGRPLPLPAPPALPLKPGDPARTAPVIAAENTLLALLADAGHPFAKAENRRVVIDRDRHTMTVAYTIDPGPAIRFGEYRIAGLSRLDPRYVARRLQWREGAGYDAREVEETRRVLVESGLFSTVRITPSPDPAASGRALMTIDTVERAHHTVGAGVGYNTSQGAAARLFWEDRDLFGGAEYLGLSAAVGQQQNELTATFRRPDFLAVDQNLLATAQIADDTPSAYHSRRAQISTGIERRFSRQLLGGAGLSLEKANVVELASLPSFAAGETSQHYALVGIPLYLRLDTTDDLLNPTRGWRVQFGMTPYQSVSGPDLKFVSSRVEGSTYWRLDPDGRMVLAGRAGFGSIEGASLAALPADKRLYAGGGGSVRAYGYQLAGPLDPDNKPFGGKSNLDLGVEFRWRITPTIGIVPFVDAGSFYEKSIPLLDRRMLWGPGLGLRYYTPFGPVRLDLATPFDRRRGDSPIQVYISLGQAF